MIKNTFYTLLACSLLFLSCTEEEKLPIYGEKDFIEGIDEDTIYHTISYWSFTNQDGEIVSKENYEGKVYVANFFFTRCPGICPTLTKEFKRTQEATAKLDVSFLSHTVDPRNDSVGALKRYVQKNEINTSNWNLITGNQQSIYEMGINSYLVPNQEDALAEGGFLHSDKFILIDKKSRIRGMYSGTEPKEVDQLIIDIEKLIQEDE